MRGRRAETSAGEIEIRFAGADFPRTACRYSRKDYPEYHDMLEKLFAQTGRKPRIVGEHDGVSSIVAAVEAGRGLALVPSCVASMVGSRLKLLPVKPALPAVPVVAIWCKESETELVNNFIAAARQDF